MIKGLKTPEDLVRKAFGTRQAFVLFLILAFDFDVRTEGAALDKQVAAPFTVRLETHCKAPTHIPPSDADCQTSVECFMGGKTERSEERRVGKEGRSRWSPRHIKKRERH